MMSLVTFGLETHLKQAPNPKVNGQAQPSFGRFVVAFSLGQDLDCLPQTHHSTSSTMTTTCSHLDSASSSQLVTAANCSIPSDLFSREGTIIGDTDQTRAAAPKL